MNLIFNCIEVQMKLCLCISLLFFFQKGDTLSTPLYSKSGTQSNDWQLGSIQLASQSSKYQIVFEAVEGPDYQGDISLDDIKIIPGNCPDISKNTIIFGRLTK